MILFSCRENRAYSVRKPVIAAPPHTISSIWKKIGLNKKTSKKDVNIPINERRSLFISDTEKYATANPLQPKPKELKNVLRVATFNVHGWYNPDSSKEMFTGVLEALKKIDADIICLQEAYFAKDPKKEDSFSKENIEKAFKSIGFNYGGRDTTFYPGLWGSQGNVIFSKLPIEEVQIKSYEDQAGNDKRHYIAITVTLGGKKVRIWCTHFEVKSKEVRTSQLQELIKDMNKYKGTCEIIFAGDFNAVRPNDYRYQVDGYTVWDLYTATIPPKYKQKTYPFATMLEKNEKSFGILNIFDEKPHLKPGYTTWNGSIIDYIYYRKTPQITLVQAQPLYNASSDHLPIVADFEITI